MASFKRYYYLVFWTCLLVACQSNEPMTPDLVLEGWVEAGRAPIVMLHKGYVLDMQNDPDATLKEIILQQLVVFGRVTIDDGQRSALLGGRVDTAYIPPYLYTTIDIKGEECKTFNITARYKDNILSATTSIPSKKASFDSIVVYEDFGSMRMKGYVSSVSAEDKFIVMLHSMNQRQYKICPLGAISGKQAQDQSLVVDIRNISADKSGGITDIFRFPKSDSLTYSIKFATVDDESFQFWEAYAAQSMTQGILFMPVYKNIPTNINNGLGYWCGMNSSEYVIKTDSNRVYRY